jgi:hypothetical protein
LEHVSFSWLKDRFSATGIPLLKVALPNDGKSALIHLKQFEQNDQRKTEVSCIFQGNLEDDPKSYVVLTGGCPFENNFEVFHAN